MALGSRPATFTIQAHLIGSAKPWRRVFLADYTLWAKLVFAVLRESMCVVSLLPCVADCYERFASTTIKGRLLLLLAHFAWLIMIHRVAMDFPCGCTLVIPQKLVTFLVVPQYFDVKLPITLWSDRVRRFEKKFSKCDNSFFCKISVSIR